MSHLAWFFIFAENLGLSSCDYMRRTGKLLQFPTLHNVISLKKTCRLHPQHAVGTISVRITQPITTSDAWRTENRVECGCRLTFALLVNSDIKQLSLFILRAWPSKKLTSFITIIAMSLHKCLVKILLCIHRKVYSNRTSKALWNWHISTHINQASLSQDKMAMQTKKLS